MDLLSTIEKNNIASVLTDYEVLGQAVAKLYLAFPNPNAWTYSNIVGVVSLVRRLNNFSFKIVDPEKREIIWEYDIDSNMTYEPSEDYLYSFPYKTIKCMAGFSFTDVSEGQEFYNCVVNRNISAKVSPVSSRISSPKLPTVSPITKTITIDTKTKTKEEKKKHKKSKKGLFGFGSSKSKSKKSKKGKKGGIDKSLIGKPTNFRHEQYIGYDPEKGFVTQNASPEWQEIFKKAGITPEVLADDKNRKIVNKFIQKHESQIRSQAPTIATPLTTVKKEKRPPPPPPPKKRPPPPPPPSRKPNQTRKAPPPPPPQRKKQQRPPPPPPPTRKPVKQTSVSTPPPPPRPTAAKSSSTSIPAPPQRPTTQTSVSVPPPPPRPSAPSSASIPAPPQRPTVQSSVSVPPPPPRPSVETPSSIPVPPPLPQVQKSTSSSAASIPPPPPVGGSIPPPPPPPSIPTGSGAPPPPPPPPVPSSGNAKSDLLASIRNAGGISSLKHVDESEKRDASGLVTPGSAAGPRPAPAPAAGSSGPKVGMSGDLLASIRNAGGIASLKHVDKSEIRDASSAKPAAAAPDKTNDLAAALAQALSLRNDAFNGSDDDSDSDSDDSDSDSSEWSD